MNLHEGVAVARREPKSIAPERDRTVMTRSGRGRLHGCSGLACVYLSIQPYCSRCADGGRRVAGGPRLTDCTRHECEQQDGEHQNFRVHGLSTLYLWNRTGNSNSQSLKSICQTCAKLFSI